MKYKIKCFVWIYHLVKLQNVMSKLEINGCLLERKNARDMDHDVLRISILHIGGILYIAKGGGLKNCPSLRAKKGLLSPSENIFWEK